MTEATLTRILYMEDDPGHARLLQKILHRRGHVVEIATNGEEGLKMLDAKHYDLLLLDYNMPFPGGIDVIRALSAKNALPPTIMVAGEGNEMVAVVALMLGAADYLVKDADMKYLDLLPAVIDQVLYRQPILGNISQAKLAAPPGESLSHYLDLSEQATFRAKSLTQQLLTFARRDSPVKKLLSAKKLIDDSAGFAIRGSKSRCEFKVAPDLWTIEADEGQLGQVINNLVMNADLSMPEGGTVTVSGENVALTADNPLLLKPGEYIKISVADQGAGIPEDNLKKIFDPYFTTKDRGIGLGLATCYSIMKQHDGDITVESTPGEGATFSLYLPASSAQTAPDSPDTGREPLHGTGRILVMDDEDIVRDVLHRSLTHLGYVVVSAHNGNEAITLYEQAFKSAQPFDAVIMDLTIPGGMGGREAVIKLREIDPAVRAIVSSGYSDDPIMAHFKDYGFSGVVSKPYTLKALSETVHSVISGNAA